VTGSLLLADECQLVFRLGLSDEIVDPRFPAIAAAGEEGCRQ
jgi:hypothetical protein